ncbi:DEAD/DEAH box helicase family protein [Gemmata sp. G18]|uniref:DEAD/DEAH box helicase family protein n=1 Tax=Gemmata palustris TaxID=2822762 RepID=A0ABS5BMV5_9BACT|nr:helicase-related protein [Gemmata palustris]MBP3955045.1 DEAD/DEAH box helicase family protein [Gemmata palustris]
MRLIPNSGSNRVLDVLKAVLLPGSSVDFATTELSLFAFAELRELVTAAAECRLVLPDPTAHNLALLGGDADRPRRNQLTARGLAAHCSRWVSASTRVQQAPAPLPQSAIVVHPPTTGGTAALTGNCPLTTAGLGLTPGDLYGLIQFAESPEEAKLLGGWFTQLWEGTRAGGDAKGRLLTRLQELVDHRPAETPYHLSLLNLFHQHGEELDEERIVKTATGIKNTAIWKKLFRFQRDGAVGAIDKLERFGGCIIADSVGLGKTFEALAVVKYYELRNDRVLVLCPKRLRDNWTLYKANDRRNVLAGDRFHYDVLNHTDLSRDEGMSGDTNLAHINWGNYDLVVIDESHNFRNKKTPKAGGETRYDKLMRRIIKDGVRTRVLMLSATPVNNRLADLKNQITFATEGNDAALAEQGVGSVEATVRLAQAQFNKWLKLDEADRRPARLMDMLGFDYFQLLDLLTIARSRKHVEKYYGTKETGKFPERLKPVNIKADVDAAREFRPIAEINDEIRRLNLSSYAPLQYVLPAKQAAYDKKYSQQVKGGTGLFKQSQREESLIQLLRVNVLKRMESAVPAFALTVERHLRDVQGVLGRIDAHAAEVEEVDIEDVDIDAPEFETLLVGNKVKVLLKDVDRVRWRQELVEDRDRLSQLLAAARQVKPDRDAKLRELKKVIEEKVRNPINPGNRKVIVFTAFADTAQYLYDCLAPWAGRLGLQTAMVTGSGRNRCTLPDLHTDMSTILSAFAPRAKERPADMAAEGEIDLLVATDCISEGQNLQDCDFLVNYDIHWNPVRIIQRFGRIDRIGSPNAVIQLVNFWPNMELEEYINLEQRVSGRMVLLDISATGEENVIEQQSGNQMNDLEYRRKQLLKLQDAVIDVEDLSSGVSISDLTLNDFRIDLARQPKERRAQLATLPLCTFAVVTGGLGENPVPPGAIFCLRAVGETANKPAEPGYPLAPHYLVQVADDGTVLYPFSQAKAILDHLKRLCADQAAPDAAACDRFDKLTRHGERMEHYQKLLAAAVASVVGKKEERSTASLFMPGGTHAHKGEFAGMNDFEVVAYVAILPAEVTGVSPQQNADAVAIRARAEEIVRGWREQGRTRAALAREFQQMLGISDGEPK